MNLAQAVISHDDYTYSWREEVSPGPRFLAEHLASIPPYISRPRVHVRRMCKPQRGPLFDMNAPGNLDLADRMLRALSRAAKAQERLTFAQLYERIGFDAQQRVGHGTYRRALRILLWMCEQRKVTKDGQHRTAVFWVRAK